MHGPIADKLFPTNVRCVYQSLIYLIPLSQSMSHTAAQVGVFPHYYDHTLTLTGVYFDSVPHTPS